jgi:hypothetical protein
MNVWYSLVEILFSSIFYLWFAKIAYLHNFSGCCRSMNSQKATGFMYKFTGMYEIMINKIVLKDKILHSTFPG